MKSLSDKRLLLECMHEGHKVVFLVDTGASVGLIDKDAVKRLNLKKGKIFRGSLIGAGGSIGTANICDTVFNINNKVFNQFIMADISGVQKSIKQETGYLITGILGLPQMKQLGMKIDLSTNTIIV